MVILSPSVFFVSSVLLNEGQFLFIFNFGALNSVFELPYVSILCGSFMKKACFSVGYTTIRPGQLSTTA